MKNIEKYEKDLQILIDDGFLLLVDCANEYTSTVNTTREFMAVDLQDADKAFAGISRQEAGRIYDSVAGNKDFSKKEELNNSKNLRRFKSEYEVWYSEALELIKLILPNRVDDFINFYKRENKDKSTTGISSNITFNVIGFYVPREFEQQHAILVSAKRRFESSLFDIGNLMRADLFDSELEKASQLNKEGFVNCGGVIAGIVLEEHLQELCEKNKIDVEKNNPTINDYNNNLLKEKIIDTAQFKLIQYCADIRNKCSHKKKKSDDLSKQEEVNDLIENTEKIIKTIN